MFWTGDTDTLWFVAFERLNYRIKILEYYLEESTLPVPKKKGKKINPLLVKRVPKEKEQQF
jgi:hypothetical protein